MGGKRPKVGFCAEGIERGSLSDAPGKFYRAVIFQRIQLAKSVSMF